ncbi:MAG TPA: CDF family Co(II)/Ni(II) efflux transporter DmeF [Albidovulum sp.]|uniref:CDF family Co(II)/Ni(II) efflux transporter DmeF n=1 Tax=Albidovulum sp. TaxID=1872424 RepID=UPI002C4BBD4E|nr:CDF family Co(II)/Ni(II) efflux transporter DmeF [Albidovulum sp.]
MTGTTAAHDHVFLGQNHARNERRTWLVVALTAAMMVAEITAGTIFGSMALLADGWHMSTHALALLVAAVAYRIARNQAHNPRFTFGTGKFGDLAAFASAIVLALVAVQIGWESLQRLWEPVPIRFDEALIVAVIGLAVNLASAWLLREDHKHGHGHDHPVSAAPGAARDNNLRAAYLHVLADAMVSITAIVALVAGRSLGWVWLDPMIGIAGALVILQWSWGLMRDCGGVMLDYVPEGEELPGEVREALERDGDEIVDLHIWQLGPGYHGAIVSLVSSDPKPVAEYRARLAGLDELAHVTIEVRHRAA